MLEIEKIYRRPGQRFSGYEEGVLRLAVEARYSDNAISRMTGRSENAIRRHRRLMQLPKYRKRVITVAIMGLVSLVSLVGLSVQAHDGSDPLSAWYQSLKDPETGISCCSMQRDCQAVDDYHASATPGGYVVRIDGSTLEVPPSKVLQRTDNPTGHAVVCVGRVDGVLFPRCMVRATEG
jgi:hypothetical protein